MLFRSRDLGALHSAVAPPAMTFDGKDLYPTIDGEASTICFSLVMNHPFVDGDKRVGHAAMETFMVLNGYELRSDIDDAERTILQLAAGQLGRDKLAAWVNRHIERRS